MTVPFSVHRLILAAVVLLGLLVCVSRSYASPEPEPDADAIFSRAAALYEQGKYDEAISQYETLLASGRESGNLYYNLGNCYFKKGDAGRALLNYARSRRLIPRDGDLRSNYEFVRAQSGYGDEDSPDRFKWSSVAADMLTVDELTMLLSVVFTMIVALLVLRLFVALRAKYLILVISVMLLIAAFAGTSLIARVTLLEKEAMALAGGVAVKFEPLDTATDFFTLRQGEKIVVIEQKKGWVRVRRDDGKAGWVRDDQIGRI